MKKCEVISYFTLKKFDELKNVKRANENNENKKGELFSSDTFECSDEMAKYLTGGNDRGMVVVKVVEDLVEKPEQEENEPTISEETQEIVPNEKKKKKHGKR